MNSEEKTRTGFIAQTANDYGIDINTVEYCYNLYFKDGKNDCTGFYEELESILQRQGFISC